MAERASSPTRRVVRRTWDTTTICVLRDGPADLAEIQVGRLRIPVRIAAGHRSEVALDERGPVALDPGAESEDG